MIEIPREADTPSLRPATGSEPLVYSPPLEIQLAVYPNSIGVKYSLIVLGVVIFTMSPYRSNFELKL